MKEGASSTFFILVLILLVCTMLVAFIRCQSGVEPAGNVAGQQSFNSAINKAAISDSTRHMNSLTLERVLPMNGKYICEYVITNYNSSPVTYSLRAEVQQKTKHSAYQGYLPIGIFKTGEFDTNESRHGSFTIPEFNRNKKCVYRISLQLLDTTLQGETFVDDITAEL